MRKKRKNRDREERAAADCRGGAGGEDCLPAGEDSDPSQGHATNRSRLTEKTRSLLRNTTAVISSFLSSAKRTTKALLVAVATGKGRKLLLPQLQNSSLVASLIGSALGKVKDPSLRGNVNITSLLQRKKSVFSLSGSQNRSRKARRKLAAPLNHSLKGDLSPTRFLAGG